MPGGELSYADAIVEDVAQRRGTRYSKYCASHGCDRITEPKDRWCLECQLAGVADRASVELKPDDDIAVDDELLLMVQQWHQMKFPGALGIDSDRLEKTLIWLVGQNRHNPILRDVLLDALYVIRRRVIVWNEWLYRAPARHVQRLP